MEARLQPGSFGRLKVVERALVGQRRPGEAGAVARHLRELWELLPPNPEAADRIFETALRGRAMESADGEVTNAPSERFRKLSDEAVQMDAVAVGGLAVMAAPPAPASAPGKPELMSRRFGLVAGGAGGASGAWRAPWPVSERRRALLEVQRRTVVSERNLHTRRQRRYRRCEWRRSRWEQ